MAWANRFAKSSAALACAVLTTLAWLRSASAAAAVHALVIGNNRPFSAGGPAPASSLSLLRYADDDAAAFYELIVPLAPSAELLTVMDAETQSLYPGLSSLARAPTVGAVKAAVGRIAARAAAQRAAGQRSVVFVFFSGHGAVDYDGRPALALFDAGLTQELLYRDVLEQLPADELHLFIDACHAEAVVRPRAPDGQVVEVTPDQAQAFLVQRTLARFPHVGAIVAATTNAKAHEWDELRHGIFTHELLSALRGAADINRDRRLEYSEVYAFMAAANREVGDARARLSVVAKPPDINRRAALLELGDFPRARLAWLSEIPGQHGIIEVGDGRGRRLVTLHGDREFVADLLIPTDTSLYVRAGQQEARFSAQPGEIVAFQSLQFAPTASRERSALDDSIRRGLFAAEYGRRYYDGIVDQLPDLISVDFAEQDAARAQFWNVTRTAAGNYKLVLGGGLSTGVADVVPLIHGLKVGLRPAKVQGLAVSLEVLGASDGPLTEWHVNANAGWLWSLAHGPVRGWGGAVVAGSLLTQVPRSDASLPNEAPLSVRRSPALGAGPVLGLTTDVTPRFGMWSELELLGLLHRRDGRSVVSAVPSAWWGGSLRF